MKNILLLFASVVILSMTAASQTDFHYPIDVAYNQNEEIYYVANWGDGEGFIVTMDKSGEITGTLFSDLSYASGMVLVEDVLYVADNESIKVSPVQLPSHLVGIDINTGQELSRTQISPGWTYLELIAYDDNGHIFINDSYQNCIYKYTISTHTVETFLSPVWFPIGICYDYLEDRILFTQNSSDDSQIKSISPEGGEVTDEFWWPGYIDGLIMNGEGEYFMSSWTSNTPAWGDEPVYKLNNNLDWTFQLSGNQNRPFGMCMGHDNYLVVCSWGNHKVNFIDLTPYGTGEYDGRGKGISIYPNPGNGNVKVTLPAIQSGSAVIRAIDINGRSVYESPLQPGSAGIELALDLSYLPAGVYVLLLQEGTDIYREKLMIQ